MPWHGGEHRALSMPSNAATGLNYRGVNVLALWMAGNARGYASGAWATYRQWQEKGAQVRKGEKAASVVFWKDLNKEPDEGGNEEEGRRLVARAYSVFNADQVDGYESADLPSLPESERMEAAERFFASIPATIVHYARQPCFMPETDTVEMMPFSRFKTATGFYDVLAHELTHWTGAQARLARDLEGRFGSEAYAIEELVAELGAAFVVGQLGLPSEPHIDHAPYIASWLRALKNDSRAIFRAAGKAQQAADYLIAFQTPG